MKKSFFFDDCDVNLLKITTMKNFLFLAAFFNAAAVFGGNITIQKDGV